MLPVTGRIFIQGLSPHSGRGMPSRPGSNATWLQCARRSYANWLCLALLILILPILEESRGNRMYITDSMLDGIKFPFQPGTVPAWAVPMYTTVVPSAAIGLHGAWAGMPAQVTHAGVLGSLTSLALTADITNFFKLQVRFTNRRCRYLHASVLYVQHRSERESAD